MRVLQGLVGYIGINTSTLLLPVPMVIRAIYTEHESRRVNQPITSSLRQTRAPVSGPKSCHRPVVRLSHTRKLYRVNRSIEVVHIGFH